MDLIGDSGVPEAHAATPGAVPAGAGLPLPVGARIVHVGPHKTGTTAVQAAFWVARDAARAQGVRWAGRSRHAATAAQAVTGQPSSYGERPPSMARWHSIVRQIRAASEPRVVLSSEFLAWAGPDQVRRIVHDLDPDRVHVVVTVRPLARILASTWQQNVQAGTVAPLDAWARRVLSNPRSGFWTLQRHDALIERWAEVVGRDRVTVIVADDRDHGFILRAFEQLTGLREGSLKPVHDFSNRSLTLSEAEAIRAFNAAFRAVGGGKALHAQAMRRGSAELMKRRPPAADEPRVLLPAWAAEPVGAVSRDVVEGIVATRVRVLGDLERLVEVSGVAVEDVPETTRIHSATAAAMAAGVLVATGGARRRSRDSRPSSVPAEVTDRIPTRHMLMALGKRAVIASQVRWRRARFPGRHVQEPAPMRAPTAVESDVLQALEEALRDEGLGPAELTSVVGGVSASLRRHAPAEVADIPAGTVTPELAARLAMGILEVRGLAPDTPPRTTNGRRAWGPAPRLALPAESPDIVRLSNRDVLRTLAGRVVRIGSRRHADPDPDA